MRFTSANARENAAKSAKARRERREAALTGQQPPLLPPLDADYVAHRIACVRAHIEATDAKLRAADDASEVERYARALALLQGVEGDLSGRPKPGAYRPREPKTATSGGY